MPINKDPGIKAGLEKMLDTLEKKVVPAHTALIVVDMQNDFIAKDGTFDKEGFDLSMMQKMTPGLVSFIDEARKAGVTIIYVQSIYYQEGNPFMSPVWLEHHKRTGKGKHWKYPLCEKGSWGADFYGVKPLPGEIIVTKHRYCPFIGTDLDLILRSRGIRTIITSGVAADVCVEMTAKIGFLLDYYLVYASDLTATISMESYKNTLNNIALFYGEVVESDRILQAWKTGVK